MITVTTGYIYIGQSGWKNTTNLGGCKNWATTEQNWTFSVETTGDSLSIRGVSFFTVEEEKISEKMLDSYQEWKEGESYVIPKLSITVKGNKCPDPEQTQNCSEDPCPIHCKFVENPKTNCSAPCDGGQKTTTYTITQQPKWGGNACPSNKTEECNTHPCPANCTFEWSTWGPCSVTCGAGYMTRTPENIKHNPEGLWRIRVKVGDGTNNTSHLSWGSFNLKLYDGKNSKAKESCFTGSILI